MLEQQLGLWRIDNDRMGNDQLVVGVWRHDMVSQKLPAGISGI